MPVFSKNIGAADGRSPEAEVRRLRDYIAYMQEAVELKVRTLERDKTALEKRVKALEERQEGN